MNIITEYSLESSLISECFKAGMAAKVKGKKTGHPETPPYLVKKIEELAETTELSINEIRGKTKYKVSRATVGKIVKRTRDRMAHA